MTRAPRLRQFKSAPSTQLHRRDALKLAASAGFLGGLGTLGSLGRSLAAQAEVGPELVQLSPDIEPVVRIIEETPRERVFESAAELLRSGVDYRQFMAALYLAGIRNVDSRSAGSRFHCVYVIHAAHLLALESPAEERLLPLFWALDDFKGAQEARPRPMGPLVTHSPSGAAAIDALRTAVYDWDQDAAEFALAGMARTCGAAEAFEELWRLGARDFRPIGHKAIFVANAWRTLQTIGWRHAEPALRSLGQALASNGTQFENGLRFDDQCHRENEELIQAHTAALPDDWADSSAPGSAADAAMAEDLLAPIRAGDASAACRDVIDQLTAGQLRAGAVWDVVHLAAADFMLRRGNFSDVHAVTSVNALRVGFQTATSVETRLFLLLQAVGWMAHFALTSDLADEPQPADGTGILDLAPADADVSADPIAAAESILSTASTAPVAAARNAVAYASRHPNDPALFSAARRLVFTRAVDPHDYKYPAAAFEDIAQVSPSWQSRLLATSMLHIPDPATPESDTIQRARDAVAGL